MKANLLKDDIMKAKSKIRIGLAGTIIYLIWAMRYLVVLSVSIYNDSSLLDSIKEGEPSQELLAAIGILFCVSILTAYAFGIIRKKLKIARVAYHIWWIVLIIECGILFETLLPLLRIGDIPETIGGVLALLVVLAVKYFIPILLIPLLLIGLHGLKQIEEPENKSSTNKKLRLNCPQCGRLLKGATREMIGDIGVCPKCKAEFAIEQKGENSKEKLTE